jgi:hypothetical protein
MIQASVLTFLGVLEFEAHPSEYRSLNLCTHITLRGSGFQGICNGHIEIIESPSSNRNH